MNDTESLARFLLKFHKPLPTLAEFKERITVLDISDTTGTFQTRSSLETFILKNSRGDNRPERLNLYYEKLYQLLVTDRTLTLTAWYQRYAALPDDIDHYLNIPSKNIIQDKIINGRTNSRLGRICRSLNFDTIYNTKKLTESDSQYTLGLMLAMFNDFKIRNSLAGPAFFDQICQYSGDSGKFWSAFMLGANKPSVFNPQTYKCILDELFTGQVLLAPVMGWNSYQTAFYSSKFQHFVSTDVIQSVVSNAELLHELQHTDKTIDVSCIPSEHWDLSNYTEQVDAVLFSPPYFNLEIYDSDNQSFSNYPDYSEWLEKYWLATLIKCAAAMRPGARLGFVISNYVDQGVMNLISQDMRDIAASVLTFTDHYQIQWSARAGSRQSHKTRNGNFEDLWIFTKD